MEKQNTGAGFDGLKPKDIIDQEKRTSTHEYLETYKKEFFKVFSNERLMFCTSLIVTLIKWTLLLMILFLLILYITPLHIVFKNENYDLVIEYRNIIQGVVKTVLAGGSLGKVFSSIFGKQD